MPLSAREPFSGNRSHYKCGQFFRSWNKKVYIKLQKLNRKVILFSKQQRIRATDSFPKVLAKFKIMDVFFSANPKTNSSPGRFFLALERSPHRCHSVLGIPAFWASPRFGHSRVLGIPAFCLMEVLIMILSTATVKHPWTWLKLIKLAWFSLKEEN